MQHIGKYITAGVVGVLGLITGVRSCTSVPAGHVTILDTFGSVSEQVLTPGLHTANPFSSRVPLDVRTKEKKENLTVPTNEGLMAKLDVSILYSLQPEKAREVYNTIGKDYESVIIEPMLRNVTRDVISAHSSEDLYNPSRGVIATEITEKLKPMYDQRGIRLESVLLRDVILPNEVTAAIERKIKAKQEAEQMEYVLAKETQESERKRVEARGISDAQEIIAESLTPEYLQWRYITTLESLANSDNTTFVITPYDQKITPMLPLEQKQKE